MYAARHARRRSCTKSGGMRPPLRRALARNILRNMRQPGSPPSRLLRVPLPRTRSPADESDSSSASCKTNVSYVVPEEDPTRRMRWSDYLAARAEGAFADAESARGSAYVSPMAVPGSRGESPRRNGRARGSVASGTPVGTVRTTASELEYWHGTPLRRARPSPGNDVGATTSQLRSHPYPSSPAPGSISSLRTGVTYFEPDLSRLSINDAGAPSPPLSTRTHTGADAGASTGSRSSGSSRRSKRTFAEAGVQTPRFMRAGASSTSNAITRAASEPAAAGWPPRRTQPERDDPADHAAEPARAEPDVADALAGHGVQWHG
ncbi:hypothetical protein WOLCODRAFT_138322 [Wolfiporia cocos MD-104 SS10]|uniref:Uncharacterized protein n=1 Tax=Wolfiporia cocos (strain MD-104) TaxID=742152 RepID=A0A2H3K4P9_WOLCO|nr:hypothetical protein WOLCODRAFT_138322 [Wolfiporia cocos MD-104 SS10]